MRLWFSLCFKLQLEANKGYAEDLTEGKFSFPIVHGVRSRPENNPIMNILEFDALVVHVWLLVNL